MVKFTKIYIARFYHNKMNPHRGDVSEEKKKSWSTLVHHEIIPAKFMCIELAFQDTQ